MKINRTSQTNINRVKLELTEWEKYLEIIYLMKDGETEDIESSWNSIVKSKHWIKWAKTWLIYFFREMSN